MSVFNDRAQAGTSHRPGQVQLMQNRRIPCDDDKGVKEWLNETDDFGNGMRVPATYYLSFHDEKDSTRGTLAKQTEPLQYFFSNNTEKVGEPQANIFAKFATDIAEKAGLTSDIRLVTYPLGENVVMARLENLQDTVGKNQSVTVNVEELGKALWAATNPDDATVGTVETSINGVYTVEELDAKKLSWQTTEGPSSPASKKVRSDSKEEVALAEQQIKTYIFKFEKE
mmetsp:Transcript_29548/g.45020  ORF Transcript_29548/g.45020 Transcript_29548/m.45020 type:complete len:227 (-) Transcript_29548:39-719(-)